MGFSISEWTKAFLEQDMLIRKFNFSNNLFPEEPGEGSVLKGPIKRRLGRGVSGKTWEMEIGGLSFKASVEEGRVETADEILKFCTRLPEPYRIALKIVSDATEDGLTIYDDLGGAAGHGGCEYLNVTWLNLRTVLHECGHVFEQRLRKELGESELLNEWEKAIAADKVSVSLYGEKNTWEDLSEFCVVYAVALKSNRVSELSSLSPNRTFLFSKMIEKVNNYVNNVNNVTTTMSSRTASADADVVFYSIERDVTLMIVVTLSSLLLVALVYSVARQGRPPLLPDPAYDVAFID